MTDDYSRQLAQTPPLGWNSWNAFSCEVTEADIHDAADALVETGLFFGCEGYPDCETSFSFPAGVVTDDCACGLPRFRTASGERCLDGSCEHDRPTETTPQ